MDKFIRSVTNAIKNNNRNYSVRHIVCSSIIQRWSERMISNVKIYDMEESLKAASYPMATDTEIININNGLCQKLGTTEIGTGHDNFLNGILVSFDLTFSNKAWVELERYNFIDFVSSQSTMHRVAKFDLRKQYNQYVDIRIIGIMEELKERYNTTQDKEDYLKLLYSNPSGFQLTARLTTNYRQLKTIYKQRKNHRLPEWRYLCNWIEMLPNFQGLCI